MNKEKIIKTVKILGIICVVIFIIFLLMDNIIMPLFVRHGMEFPIPDVSLKHFEEARQILRDKGLNPVQSEEQYNPNHRTGTVLLQNPLPNSMVKKGRTVYLTVSAGERLAIMPDLRRSSARDAELKIVNAQLVPGEKFYEYNSFYPEGVVFKQSHEPGTSIQKGTVIDITISQGEEPTEIIVPDVRSHILGEAIEILRKKGLIVGNVTSRLNNELVPNTVLGQSMAPDCVASVNDTINIIVSRDSTIKY